MVERDLAKVEVAGSSPVIRSIFFEKEEMQIFSFLIGSIAQLGEHLPYKQRVIGSSPIVSTSARAHIIARLRSKRVQFGTKCQIMAR